MAAAAILDFEKLMLFSYLLTNFHQVWWKCCDVEKQHIYDIEKQLTSAYQYGTADILNFEKLKPLFKLQMETPLHYKTEDVGD